MNVGGEIARARRSTVGDAVRRAARVHRDSTALIFGERELRWRYGD